jgi:hypothetical protein
MTATIFNFFSVSFDVQGRMQCGQQQVRIQVKQDNPDFYEFIPGLPSPWDMVKATALVFQGRFERPVRERAFKLDSRTPGGTRYQDHQQHTTSRSPCASCSRPNGSSGFGKWWKSNQSLV